MNIFDIIGPVMVGPSSSHTAGAVRLGNAALAILGEAVAEAAVGLHGSFAQTGRGHGTDLALVAGLMGWSTDDIRIPQAFAYAREIGLKYCLKNINAGDAAHPNFVKIHLKGRKGGESEMAGASVGGGQIIIKEVDGFPLEFTGDFPTILTLHEDRPGAVAEVTGILSRRGVNIAQMRVFRRNKGGLASMVLETDQPVDDADIAAVAALPLIRSVRHIPAIS
ncbi:L-serine ammonia-lyase, iron-sulfur-dependent subunit beta [Sporomusa acidovorans]|uniref:L-serine deaminase n=1 Tax=Sporomusa acidovorans (strain ATCC 49682 / DSM 3132 / Mol) TaxID=1123286 RepID=A0ABZ3J152_SPOA4|nr:L-serine ammonia-lyase, iron-sulfur-dependent subunit beta [Sporomusa acidovorans]OZC14984.1 L-serine dehydratase, beta chain [Sporomusa acidovorans DSM 3132]SDE83447.1 L-serine dehydratase [Sporomusa acidovorans]